MLVTGSFFAVVVVLASRSSAQVTSPAVTATGDPCAVVSSLVASQPQATPVPIIPPSKALACLDAVPLDNAKASAFIDYLRPFLQFQSSLVYLKNPPTGYMVPGVDILGGLDQIQNNIQSGTYKSHWAFEKDYSTLINIMPKDFHLVLGGSVPLGSVILFGTALHLVSVSSDGLKVPQIYVKSDLDAVATANLAGITLNWLPSSVVSIDNVPVSDYLQVKSLYSVYQDPDALFNQLFYSPALAFQNNGDAFSLRSNPFGLNDTSSFIFANDTKPQVFSNFAYVVGNFTNINSGADLFSKFVLPATTTSSTQQATTTQPPLTTITGYPNNPVAAHPQGYTAGFFLDGYNDTCILVMSGFEGQNTQDTRDQLEQQQAIQDTLSNCTAAGKTKLIIDLSANGGGHIFSGIDAFKQLFPSIEPFGGSRLRSTPLAQFFINLFSESGIYNSTDFTPYQTQAVVDVNENDFASPQAMYGPFQFYGDNFTAELRLNLSDPTQSSSFNGIVVSGYGARANIAPQPFTPDNIVMIMDGTCGSTCSIFAELMKTQAGVRSVATGGRPQIGPMQYVAGSKGSQVFPFSAIQTLLSFASLLNETFTALGKQIPALPSPDWIPSGAQPPLGPSLGESAPSVNLRNAFNPDDASQTPLQFIYEAANCRLFYTYPDLQQVSSLWKRVYDTVWGNGTCVEGSTTSNNNIISKIANDTVPFSEKFLSNATNPFTGPGSLGGASGSGSPTTSGTGSTTSSGAQATGTKNGSGRLVSSGILLCVGLGFGFAFS